MEIKVYRKWLNNKNTIGEMYIDGIFYCFTLEDKVRNNEPKVPGETAIPKGKYKVIIDQSARFKCEMPHILNVPNFEGVRIHCGNTQADTEGCILVGFKHVGNTIEQSHDAFAFLFIKMKAAKEITIEIVEV
jgi:hypothetical protein